MRCEPSFIAEQPRGSFAVFIRNTAKNAITLKFPLMPRFNTMSREQYDAVLGANREKYAVHYLQAMGAPAASTSEAASLQPSAPKVTAPLSPNPSIPRQSHDDWRS
jgi:hypothetical protein